MCSPAAPASPCKESVVHVTVALQLVSKLSDLQLGNSAVPSVMAMDSEKVKPILFLYRLSQVSVASVYAVS